MKEKPVGQRQNRTSNPIVQARKKVLKGKEVDNSRLVIASTRGIMQHLYFGFEFL